MKMQSLRLRWPSFFGQRIHGSDSSGQMPVLLKPEPEWPGAEGVIKDILRWADDGGKMLDLIDYRTARSDLDDTQERKNKR